MRNINLDKYLWPALIIGCLALSIEYAFESKWLMAFNEFLIATLAHGIYSRDREAGKY